ncbi:hypothetical protein H9Q10_07160 [Eikenella sp. S3360]|uniref:Uncharacterized protein n=1 Tax=Eikenella glucosivorans TaxID=2766967 RepID=A0ABS0NAV4_9NEIS|nr:hypothetical protein [Eikenella glucosivorans]MBH5329443.1 hypothetical protein [Eikenella glucosivorans]
MKKLLPFLLLAPLCASAQPLGAGTYKHVEWGVHGGADIRKMLVIEVLPNSRYCLLSISNYKEDSAAGRWQRRGNSIRLDNGLHLQQRNGQVYAGSQAVQYETYASKGREDYAAAVCNEIATDSMPSR